MENKYGYYGNWVADNASNTDNSVPTLIHMRNRRSGDCSSGQHQHQQQRQQRYDVPMKDASTNQQPFNLAKNKDGRESNSDPPKPKKGLGRIFRRFAEKSSMQGPSYIVGSKWWLPRVLWVFFLVAALIFMSLHLYYLCQTYLAWPTKNKITLGFSSLPFPAVTICNVNRVRASRLKDLSEDFQNLVALVHPENTENNIDEVLAFNDTRLQFNDTAEQHNDTAGQYNDTTGQYNDTTGQYNDTTGQYNNTRRQKRETRSDEDESKLNDFDFGVGGINYTTAREEADDDFYIENLDGYFDSWEAEAKDSTFYRIEQKFREIYAAEDRSARIEAGHKLRHMLVSCSFGGKSCRTKNFTLTTSATYGNCYTLQYPKFISRRSGPIGGLELLIFLDLDDYVREITPDDGLQVTIHPQNTMPFAYEEGLAVSAGEHTKLSLKLVQIERLGHPYSVCFDSTEYLQEYGIEYSRQTCQKFCEQKLIHSTCNCRDETDDDINRIIMGDNWIKPCRNRTEIHCMFDAQWRYRIGTVQCKCEDPCQESKFVKSMSSRPWPDKEYIKRVLLKKACLNESSLLCQKMKKKSIEELSRELVKLSIFYEDLNYENITEEADYEDVQFVSDIGGTVGLWIGLSVLSVMEVLQLVVELFRYLCCCRWRQ